MTKIEHLLTCMSEECAEVIKEVSKALRFGLDDSHPCEPGTNHVRIERELNDLYGTIELLAENGIHFKRVEALVFDKKLRIKNFMGYAIQRKTITD